VTYRYDGLGRRTARDEGGAVTRYLYGNPDDPFEVTATRDPDGSLSRWYHDEDGLLVAVERGGSRYLVATQFSEELLRYELLGKHPNNVNRSVLEMITLPDRQPVGCFTHPDYLWWTEKIACQFFELLPGVSWFEAAPAVLRALEQAGQQLAEREGKPRLNWVTLALCRGHPAYAALDFLNSDDPHPYAWYLRLPDLLGFLRLVAPALESNLASSGSAGWTGSLKFTFYRSAIELTFEQGKLAKAEPVDVYWEKANAAFPGRTFLQLLFGYRSLAELEYAFPDCWSDRELRPLIDAIFPKKPSFVLPIS
jgi:YD repeat-containing protein